MSSTVGSSSIKPVHVLNDKKQRPAKEIWSADLLQQILNLLSDPILPLDPKGDFKKVDLNSDYPKIYTVPSEIKGIAMALSTIVLKNIFSKNDQVEKKKENKEKKNIL